VTEGTPSAEVQVIEDFSTGYHSRNGGGDLIQTDGDLPILDLRAVPAELLSQDDESDSRDKRPAQTVFGAAVAVLRGLVTLGTALMIVLMRGQAEVALEGSLDGVSELAVIIAVAAVVGLFGVVDILLGVATFVGRNWARLTLMLYSVFATTSAFLSSVTGVEVAGLAQLPTIAGGTLVLLALSSHRAREFAVRGRHHATAPGTRVLDQITP
jgi:hypothetical protein